MFKFLRLLLLGSLVLLTACTGLEKEKETSNVENYLTSNSPWVTTAVYKENNGKVDTSKNYIDTDIANGTISSAQYKNGKFIFVFLKDYKTGEFTHQISKNIMNTKTKGDKAIGFIHGNFRILESDGEIIRELYNPSFNPNAIVKRTLTEVNDNIFTYKFKKDNATYYVEHKPYHSTFKNIPYPIELQEAVDSFFRE